MEITAILSIALEKVLWKTARLKKKIRNLNKNILSGSHFVSMATPSSRLVAAALMR